MCTFIEDYLLNPSHAIANARQRACRNLLSQDYPDDRIYAELSSPEFRLYEEIIL